MAITSRARSMHAVDVTSDRGRRRFPPSASVMIRAPSPRRSAGTPAGVATVTSPAPERSAPIADEMRRAGLAARSGDDQHAAVVALVAVRRPRRDQLAHRAARQQLDAAARRPTRCTSAGMPMSAMTMSPARVSPGGRTSGSFGAPSVTVRPASIDGADRLRRIGRQAGRQIDRHDRNARRVDVGNHRLDQA